MDANMKKSLTDLIDETLMELEELKKSRFAASEVDLKGPGEGIAGKPSNGDLHAKKAEDAEKADDEDDKDEDDDKEDKAEKGEGKNREADPNGGHHKMDKGEGKNREADPNGGHHKMDKADAEKADAEKADMDKKEDKKDKKKDKDEDKDDDKDDKKNFFDKNDSRSGMPEGTAAKSVEEQTSLMKSMIDDRVKPLEDKLGTILELVNRIADQPVAPKGITSKAIPLFKSEGEEVAPLNKHQVSNKLFELKKSGTKVESLDVTRAELGQDLDFISKKYNLSK
jgi:hypothetical protein